MTDVVSVRGVNHVGLVVSDLGRTVQFWQQVLGFTLQGETDIGGPLVDGTTAVPGARGRVAFLSKDGFTLEVIEFTAPDERATYRPRLTEVGSWHLALQVTGLDDLLRECGRWGWTLSGQLMTVTQSPGPLGARIACIKNGDGTILELIELPSSNASHPS